MNRDGKILSVIDRAEAALEHLLADGENVTVSVSQICRIAGVSRANVYENHPDFVDRIRLMRQRTSRTAEDEISILAKVKMENETLRRQNRALLYLCVELKSKLTNMEERL